MTAVLLDVFAWLGEVVGHDHDKAAAATASGGHRGGRKGGEEGDLEEGGEGDICARGS